MTEILASSPILFALSAGVLGLIVGSFLNVVILRLPRMMEADWAAECRAFLRDRGEAVAEPDAGPRLSLWQPPSTCPACGHRIRPFENIPLLSWLWLRGRCSRCGQRISVQYPLVEATAGFLAAIAAWHFGFGWPAAWAMLLSFALLTLAVIDLRTQLLPDDITLPLLWLGLLANLSGTGFTDLTAAVIGAVAGYGSLWSVYHLFRLLTGKEGMGYGDFKLLAMLGAWLGWQMLPLVILLSAVMGAAVGITLIVLRRQERGVPIPYGPWLASAGWIALTWGHEINRAYLGSIGL